MENKEVSLIQGKALAKQMNLMLFETSSKHNIMIDEMFDYLIKEILKTKNPRYTPTASPLSSTTFALLKTETCTNKNKKCC